MPLLLYLPFVVFFVVPSVAPRELRVTIEKLVKSVDKIRIVHEE